jgi:hypothetical protein
MAKSIRKKKISQFYLHCFPEICTDAPRHSKHFAFYSQFKSCLNISTSCHQGTAAASSSTSTAAPTTALIESVSLYADELVDEETMGDEEEYEEIVDGTGGKTPQYQSLVRQKRWTSEHFVQLKSGSSSHQRVVLFDELNQDAYFPAILNQCNNKYSHGPVRLATHSAIHDQAGVNVSGGAGKSSINGAATSSLRFYGKIKLDFNQINHVYKL